MSTFQVNEDFVYERITAKISGYATTYNCINSNFPFIESIKSFLPVCDEIVVLDGLSDDGTYERLEELQKEYPDKLVLYQNPFDWTEPGIDGMQKAFARALCSHDYLVQFDVDEFIHEKDYEKWKLLTKRFPKGVDILHLPVAELWGDSQTVTGRRHSWKWRVSRNKPEITHGINIHSRLTDEKTGKVYAKTGGSDGCEYVNVMTYEMLPHVGFYLANRQIEMARISNPNDYADIMNQVFSMLPTVYHVSWLNIPRKIEQLKPGGVWDKMWSLLYKQETQNRFPDVDFSDAEQVKKLALKLHEQGGEDSDEIKYKFELKIPAPMLLREWSDK